MKPKTIKSLTELDQKHRLLEYLRLQLIFEHLLNAYYSINGRPLIEYPLYIEIHNEEYWIIIISYLNNIDFIMHLINSVMRKDHGTQNQRKLKQEIHLINNN